MTMINVPERDMVEPGSQVIFDLMKRRLGKIPNLYATIGYSANALQGLLGFEENLNKGVFTASQREAVALLVSELNGCPYCLAAHTVLAVSKGFTKDETLAIRQGFSSDVRLSAILNLTTSILENKGKASREVITKFFDEGYNEAALMDLVGLVVVRIFTNYVYALTEIPIDFPAADPLPIKT
jgi:AhpD family alkylhydroperoxidase